MTLRLRIGLYLVALHLALFGCVLALLRERTLLFVAAECLLLASLALGWRLLRRALEPLGYTRRFRDLLHDQQYAHRLAAPVGDGPGGELGDLVGMFNTMLDALHRERLAMGEQQGFLDRLLEATPAAVVVFDFDGAVSLANASAVSLLGLEKPLARPLSAWEGGLLRQLEALPLGESRLLTDTDGRRYRAQRGQFFDRGFARHFLVVEELTAELEDSERAAYARLIRVLAHEVNNTVAATGSVLDSLLHYRGQLALDDADDFATAIVAVRRRNTRLGGFIDRFTSVVKMPAPEPHPTDLSAVVDDILRLNREHCAQRGIALGWGRRDAVAPLPLDVQLFEQALLNIVKNAIEAVEEGGKEGGAVRIDLVDEGGAVRLTVADSANLLANAPVRQLFTPFYSTKKGGQGIGLMFVREVLHRHGCTYALAPGADGETRFEIRFPTP